MAMIFYAPLRGMREVRDRGSLAPLIVCAYVSQIAYSVLSNWYSGSGTLRPGPVALVGILFHSAGSLLPVAVLLVPLLAFMANVFDRRGTFGIVIRQEYVSLASAVFYGFIAANLAAILIATFLHFTGIQAQYVANMTQSQPQTMEMFRSFGMSEAFLTQFSSFYYIPASIAQILFFEIKLALFAVGTLLAVSAVFRASLVRSLAIVTLGFIVSFPLWAISYQLFHTLIGSPFLLLMLFFLLRGYLGEVTRSHQARANFKRNLEAATLNPADASAHYNLGLIHQQRGELDQARERFERAVHIDADEVDAHYQLGRIARAQNRWADAIGAFEQVVTRDQTHAQHEIWREIGATYIAAGQFEDARDALERFLDSRQMDPEGLYMMGRAHAGLGHRREAASSMQACIEAVKTAPAYKYRTEKRWLNEAQQFLRTQIGA
jgi:tetratricopeptide (TPR) repeat protein